MNWKQFAIEDLKKYNSLKQSLTNIDERIQAVEYRKQAIKSSTISAVPMHGGGTKYEDNLLTAIVEAERLKLNKLEAAKLVELIERGLGALNDTEKKVLAEFYINRRPRHLDRLSEELHVEKSEIYRTKDEALYKFTISMFGLVDY